jgi:hypothetical protein
MKQSDSTTSLTGLVVCDTACYFCNESGDIEHGNPLVDMKKFLNCECRLTAHTMCWLKHLADKKEHAPVACPLCNTSIAGWKKQQATESVHEPTTTPKCKSCLRWNSVTKFVCGIVVVVIFATTLIVLKVTGIL